MESHEDHKRRMEMQAKAYPKFDVADNGYLSIPYTEHSRLGKHRNRKNHGNKVSGNKKYNASRKMVQIPHGQLRSARR